MKKLTLVLGGARSGKSDFAQTRAIESGSQVLYVATATAGDDDMRVRIKNHQQSRPASWITLEAPVDVGTAIRNEKNEYELVLIDCMTLLVSNLIMSLPEPVDLESAMMLANQEVDRLLDAYSHNKYPWIIVSNEVGLGVVPPSQLGRLYRDILGRVNQGLAKAANEVIFMVSGIPMQVK